jgi:hypothetical protein
MVACPYFCITNNKGENMARRNWSTSEANNDRKSHAAHYAAKRERYGTSEVITKIDFALVAASFQSKFDPNAKQTYQPPIVGKSICR